MGFPRITYGPSYSKTINFVDKPVQRNIDISPSRTVNRTLTGQLEVLLNPRVDVKIQAEFASIDSLSLLAAFENWWQWAQQGNNWKLALDSDRLVETYLGTNEAAGATLLRIGGSVAGITTGRDYVVISGPYYQVVHVAAVAGTGVTISSGLDHAMGGGLGYSIFRDEYYWNCVIVDDRAPSPIRFIRDGQTFPPQRFDLSIECIELNTGT